MKQKICIPCSYKGTHTIGVLVTNVTLTCELMNKCTNKKTALVIAIVIYLLTLVQRDSSLLTIMNLERIFFTIYLGGDYGCVHQITTQNKQILLKMTFSSEFSRECGIAHIAMPHSSKLNKTTLQCFQCHILLEKWYYTAFYVHLSSSFIFNMAAVGHFGFWLLQNSAAIFARVMGAHFFLYTPKSSNQVPNLNMLSVVTGTPDITQL